MRDVIVMGSGRSGTSLVAGTLAGAGYFMGDSLVEPRESNPRGFYESRAINATNEAILAHAVPHRDEEDMARPDIPLPRQLWLARLPVDAPMRDDQTIRERIAAHVARRPFCYKDPRFCYTLDVWRPHLPADAALVCVFRAPAVTARSILREIDTARYLSNVRLSFDQALDVWRCMYARVLQRLRHEGDWRFIHYRQMFDADAVAGLAAHCDARIDPAFADRALERTVADDRIDERVMRMYRELCALAGYDGDAG